MMHKHTHRFPLIAELKDMNKHLNKNDSTFVRTNSPRAWFLATRPKTLSGALVPVVAATALAFANGKSSWATAFLCMAFAAIMQIAANFINDLYDFIKGTDGADRLGPERACAQGWIKPDAMRQGIAVSIAMAVIVGLGALAASFPYDEFRMAGSQPQFILHYAGPLLVMGLLCVVFAFLYTTLLSYVGLGDMLVWLFFGFIPVLGTYYVITHTLTTEAWMLGGACGLVIDTLLALNNYRDRDTDRQSGKRTLIAVLGEPFGRYYYLGVGIVGCLLAMMLGKRGYIGAALAVTPYLLLHISAWRTMIRIFKGRELNKVLALTSQNILIFGLLLAIGLAMHTL